MIILPDADLSPHPSRYYAADFYKLTNRRATSPITPDFALPDPVLPAPAPTTENRRTAVTADRRAFFRHDALPCVLARGFPPSSRLRQGSVKEETGGEITHLFSFDIFIVPSGLELYSPSFPPAGANQQLCGQAQRSHSLNPSTPLFPQFNTMKPRMSSLRTAGLVPAVVDAADQIAGGHRLPEATVELGAIRPRGRASQS
ncbi:MAG: hypothetical protein Q9179_004874 [Wetmoreana sp. 5 TL-2023]